jgi:hypothetical protein
VKKQIARYAKTAMETQWRPAQMVRKHWLTSWVITTVIRPLSTASVMIIKLYWGFMPALYYVTKRPIMKPTRVLSKVNLYLLFLFLLSIVCCEKTYCLICETDK